MRRKYKNSICVCFSLTIRKHAALPVILNLKSWTKKYNYGE
jgi:hypothetical protein